MVKCRDCKWWRDHLPKRKINEVPPAKGWWIFPPSVHTVLHWNHKMNIKLRDTLWNNSGDCHFKSVKVCTKPDDYCSHFDDVA